MRIHRLQLRDFRGVQSLDVALNPSGVSVIQGRNEAGKTSLADAFLMLLDHKDSSAKAQVKDAQPVGRDVGPFVEAHMTVGPYTMVYRKQWLRGRLTELTISTPLPEQLAGEQAHQRVLEILEQETDTALFRALRYQQGVPITQADVADAPSLIAALDHAGGGAPGAAPKHDALRDRVDAERLRYFTPSGALPVARRAKEDLLHKLGDEEAALQTRIRELEATVTRQEALQHELLALQASKPALEVQLQQATAAVAAIEQVERALERAQLVHERAQTSLREASAVRDSRTALKTAADEAVDALATLEADLDATTIPLTRHRDALAALTQSHALAVAEVENIERAEHLARQTLERVEMRMRHEQLKQRLEAVVSAELTIEEAQRFLTACKVDATRLRQLEAAGDDLALAKAHARAGQPRVLVELLKDTPLQIDGRPCDGVAGSPIPLSVATTLEIAIADLARVTITPSHDGDATAEKLAATERAFEELLRECAANSVAHARELARSRQNHEDALAHGRRRKTSALGGFEREELVAQVQELEAQLAGDRPAPGDTAALAHRSAAEIAARLHAARGTTATKATALTAARTALRVLEDQAIQQTTRIEGAQTQAQQTTCALQEQRAAHNDDTIEEAFVGARAAAQRAAQALDAAQGELTRADGPTARAVLENAQELQLRLQRDIAAHEIERAQTLARLEVEGHAGLADRLAHVHAEWSELHREIEAETRRANAAALLHEVLSDKRAAAQNAYIGPYADKLNAYGRILYGPDVQIHVDPVTFNVHSRTLNATTVAFSALSGGAREQLAVLARLACGALVSPPRDGGSEPAGVPVIIDDALGYSDQNRLEKLGTALRVAGQDCQVIVLTCDPTRYRGVGGAHVVTLSV